MLVELFFMVEGLRNYTSGKLTFGGAVMQVPVHYKFYRNEQVSSINDSEPQSDGASTSYRSKKRTWYVCFQYDIEITAVCFIYEICASRKL